MTRSSSGSEKLLGFGAPDVQPRGARARAHLVLKYFIQRIPDCTPTSAESRSQRRRIAVTGRARGDSFDLRFRMRCGSIHGRKRENGNVSRGAGTSRHNQIWLAESRTPESVNSDGPVPEGGRGGEGCAPSFVSEIQSVRWKDIADTRRNKVRRERSYLPAANIHRIRQRNELRPNVYLPRQLVSRATISSFR